MPTRAEYVKFLRSLEGGYGPARGLANNDNQFNTWYYGRRVSGDNYAWCAVTECYVENHFDILMINGGKVAYVPNMVAVAKRAGAKVWHKPRTVPEQGTSWAKPGNKITFDFNRTNEAEHTGTFVKRLSATRILTSEGNTSTSKYSDALAPKERDVADVLDVIELLGVDEEDDMQPSDKLKIGDWMKKLWAKDPTITDGTIAVNTALGSGYGHSRAAHENTDALKTMVAGLQQTVAALAANSNQLDADAVARAVLAQLSPAAIAAAVTDALPADLAEQVVTELGDRIKTG